MKVEFADMAAAPWPRYVTYFISSAEIFAEQGLLKGAVIARPGRQGACVFWSGMGALRGPVAGRNLNWDKLPCCLWREKPTCVCTDEPIMPS